MINNYLHYLTHTRWYSEATVTGYRKILKKFDERLLLRGKTANDPESIKLVDIYSFLGDMSEAGLSARTCAWTIDWVRGYLRYCKQILELEIIDLHKVKSPKVPDRKMEFFTEEEKKLILDYVNGGVGAKEETQLKNRVLTYMFLHTGLRCHEIAKVRVNEIWQSLQVIWKGWVRRFVFLRPELLDMIYLYLGKRKTKSDFLFPGRWGKHVSTDHIRKTFNKISKAIWIHVHAHKFRHTFATDLLHVPNANIYAVSKLLGHKRITTTQIYLGTDNRELKSIQFWLKFM